MKILVSGFEPFNHALTNSSELVVREIAKHDFDFEVVSVILPVVYEKAFTELSDIIEAKQPDAVVSLGQAEGRTAISLERLAQNKDDVKLADNAGVIRTDIPIVPGAEATLPTTLPIGKIFDELLKAHIPVENSDSAGNFLCNNIFYHSQYSFQSLITGFIHLPLAESQAPEFPQKPTLPLPLMVQGIEITLKTIAVELQKAT